MPSPTRGQNGDRSRIATCFEAAKAVWGVNVNLSPPEPLDEGASAGPAGPDPLAYIDLSVRQIKVNFEMLERIGAPDSLTAVLAHEIGHHTRFPHSLRLLADLIVMEKRLIPGLPSSLTNLFFDLQVNEVVGREHSLALVAVYKGFASRPDTRMDPLFAFYLAVYEELWGLDEGDLIGAESARMNERFPGFRAEAALFAQTFFALDDVFLQFAYFAARFMRFLGPPGEATAVVPLSCDLPEPSVDDYDGALSENPRAEGALDEAAKRGWIKRKPGAAQNPFDVIDSISAGGHGRGAAEFRQALVERHYARLVERNLFEIPPAGDPDGPEPSIPSTISPWEAGDDPGSIDWFQSVASRGVLAGAMPLRRDLEPDGEGDIATDSPAVEIYLDTSGSMPNPSRGLNAMTLAALVLSASCIRREGRVRAIIYSDGKPMISEWLRDETAARRYLLNFAGGGTLFPFRDMERLCDEGPGAIRVIVSDDGFLQDLNRGNAKSALTKAAGRSRALVALLLTWQDAPLVPGAAAPLASSEAMKFVFVRDAAALAGAAAALGRALFGEGRSRRP